MLGIGLRISLAVMVGFLLGAPARAAYPERPIRIIVPWNPGAAADVMARAMANVMARDLGKSVVVENRPGASGGIGAQVAARSAPDGYTLLVSNADTHAINPFVYRKLPYDPIKDFVGISLFAQIPFALVAGPARPEITDLKSFVATAKSNPASVTYASWGMGSTSHIGMEIITRAVGVSMNHVPFSGQAPGILAVEGSQVDTMLLTAGGANSAAQGGRVKLLGVAAEKRLDLMPTTATLRELGLDIVTGNWFALHAPAGTPPDIVRRLTDVVAATLRDPAVLETFRVQAAIAQSTTSEALGKFVAEEQVRWGDVIRAANIVIE